MKDAYKVQNEKLETVVAELTREMIEMAQSHQEQITELKIAHDKALTSLKESHENEVKGRG